MRGGDTSALRTFNTRLVIGAIRNNGPLSKAEIARATGLSAQAAAAIVNDLRKQRLLTSLPKVKGGIGQPSTPMALDPEGVFSLGVKVGRRSAEAVLIDFLGAPVAERRRPYAAPLPEVASREALSCLEELLAHAGPRRARIASIGIAMPSELFAWSRELGLPCGALDGWRELDIGAVVRSATGLEAELYNDATAACAAEMAQGRTIAGGSVLYVYMGTFVGGGLVLDGRLYRGGRGNAAAIGSLPMVDLGEDGRVRQLIHEASLVLLERRLIEEGLDPAAAFEDETDAKVAAVVADWTASAASALARAVLSVAAVVDIESVVIDGLFGAQRRAALVDAVDGALGTLDHKGINPFSVQVGNVGRSAPVLGAALLPLNERFFPDPLVFARPLSSRAPPRRAGP